ncbi:MAG: bifunctional phosphopantothenoylcysteine decarboxylase/phosphopantothenate--cysteine ligase CoaBC [Methylotetracoccus sp.]
MSNLEGKRILLGVTGGIAAYKSCELVRLLRRDGAAVRVVMTDAAAEFVTPLSFQALSGHPVLRSMFDRAANSAMEHIDAARWADLILIAPATADFLARLRAGLADDLLSTLCLASEVPIVVAPAMNRAMWLHPATCENARTLAERGVVLIGPDSGGQACGEIGPGRMLEPEAIVAELQASLATRSLDGLRVLVSAGPTREPIDPVRFIGNRSSGKMGYALAEVATRAGATVTLVSGPTALPPPAGVVFVSVETAEEMCRAVLDRLGGQHIYVGAAAIADYRPDRVAASKIKKHADELPLRLVRTTDVLRVVAATHPRPFVVGFAAETNEVEHHAIDKLIDKGADMIAANRVGGPTGGFERDDNELTVFWRGGSARLPLASKHAIARQLIDLIADRYHAEHSDQDSRSAPRA